MSYRESGLSQYHHKKRVFTVPSGDEKLDELLQGGFRQGLLYLVYGNDKRITNIIFKTVVNCYKEEKFGNKVAFVVGNNRFNPYAVSKLVYHSNLNPRIVLEHILISRAFTWHQMVEDLENQILELENIKMLIISGFTCLWPDHELKTFETLINALNGLKKAMAKLNPLTILTCPLNEYSSFKPKGGRYLTHFGHVLVMITEDECFVDYTLVKYPYLPENRVRRWKSRRPKIRLARPVYSTLDQWMEKDS